MNLSGRSSLVPFGLVAAFLGTGVASLVLAYTVVLLEPASFLLAIATPKALATVHLVTLGFGVMILVGALQQLAPVLLVTPLASVRAAYVTLVLLLTGVAGVIGGFARGYDVPLLASGAILSFLAVLVLLVNLATTYRRSRARSTVNASLIASACYLLLTIALGGLVAASRLVPEIAAILGYATPLHLALGLFGVFFLAIASTGHRLLGMFVLAHGVTQVRLRIIAGGVHAAIALLALGTFTRLETGALAIVLLIGALVVFGVDTAVIVRRRMRRVFERSIRLYLVSVSLAMLAVPLWLTGHHAAAVTIFLLGFVTLAIAGMLVKIMSFLAWQYRYAPHVGRGEVPLMHHLVRDDLENVTTAGLVSGALLLPAALVTSVPLLAHAGAFTGTIGASSLALHLLWIATGAHARRVPRATLGETA